MVRALAIFGMVIGIVAVLYGLAKIAQAEPQPREDVVVPIGGKEVSGFDPDDPALREFGVRSAGFGVICMFLSAAALVYSFRKKPPTGHGRHPVPPGHHNDKLPAPPRTA